MNFFLLHHTSFPLLNCVTSLLGPNVLSHLVICIFHSPWPGTLLSTYPFGLTICIGGVLCLQRVVLSHHIYPTVDIQVRLKDIVGWVPEHYNEANVTIR